MDFFDQMAKKISSGANIASKKTDELISTAEVKMTISKLEGEIEDAIYQLGENVYKSYITENSMAGNEIQQRCKEIRRMQQNVTRLKKSYNAHKGIAVCSVCGADIEDGYSYCPDCGNRIY